MKVCVNGVAREETDAEIAERLSQQNREKLESMQSMVLTTNDLLTYLLSQVNVTLPDGTQTNGAEIADKPVDLPVKVGFKWEQINGSNGMAWQLVEDADAVGTADNPIIWFDGCPMLDNAYYLRDGVRFVCMAGELIEF